MVTTCADPAAVAEISRLEGQVINGISADVVCIETVLAAARASGDGALEGRALCLLARTQLMQGRNEHARNVAGRALIAFEKLGAPRARSYAGLHAEAFRAAGTALSKMGRVGEALQQLEEAVRIAQAGVDNPVLPEPPNTCISAQSALMRSLMALGIAFFFIREVDAAIEAYGRAIRTADAFPSVYTHFLDDAMLARWNLVEALHERARRRQAAGDRARADDDIAAAKQLIDAQTWRFEQRGALSAAGRANYYGALAEHLLVAGKPAQAYAAFERCLAEIQRTDYLLGIATAQVGLAQAALALERPRTALEHAARALDVLDRDDESHTRAAVLLTCATAYYDLGEYQAAFHAFSRHHKLRAELEALAAQQYARHMTAKLGLERARADAESQRRVAEMLETLGTIGQELTANLDANAILRILAQRIESLLGPVALSIWLLDASGDRLVPAFRNADERAATAGEIAFNDPQSLAATAVRERRDILTATDPRGFDRAPTVTAASPQNALFAPLLAADRALGVVTIQSDRPRDFAENECLIFRTLNTYAAIALDNAAAYTKLEQTIVVLQNTQADLASKTAEFERLSLTDALTGIANRRAFTERAQIEVAALRRKPGRLAVVMFDADRFKLVNDTFGHAVGDAALVHIVSVAKRSLRPGDLIARLGGEEFALLLPTVGVDEACAIAERIRESIGDAPLAADGTLVRVTCSFGVAAFDEAFATIDDALGRADSALYLAKQAGRNQVQAAAEIEAP
jgi:diguanylate cyclase (GGDEF)-like protein